VLLEKPDLTEWAALSRAPQASSATLVYAERTRFRSGDITVGAVMDLLREEKRARVNPPVANLKAL
jgi:hypothetical protein